LAEQEREERAHGVLVSAEKALEEAGFVSVDEAQRLFFAKEAVDHVLVGLGVEEPRE
jgi:hypothetical protein